MVKIPSEIKKFVEKQGVFVVGTVGSNNLANLSPRIFFIIEADAIYWIDFFKHKSYKNFLENPWVSISVFNKDDLEGFQFMGKVKFIKKESERSTIKKNILETTLKRNSSKKVKKLAERSDFTLVKFEPKFCYSLNPEEFSGMSIGSDIDSNLLFSK